MPRSTCVCAIAIGLRLLRSMVDMMALLCRLCQSSSPSDTAVSLFSQTAAQQRLPGRITDLLDVPVDCLPGHICCKCKQKAGVSGKGSRRARDVSETRLKIHTECLVWREACLSEPSCYDVIKKRKYTKIYWNDGMSSGLSACANGRYQALFSLLPLRAWVWG